MSVVSGEPHLWCYDKDGRFHVEVDVFAARAHPNVWTDTGWDKPPRTYPSLAIRELRTAAPPLEAPAPASGRRKKGRPPRRETLIRGYRLAPETVEQIDALCEAYRLRPSAVLSRLVAEAYRRDVVESGLIALLVEDDVIAPVP